MSRQLYIIAIVLIWGIILYFFVHVSVSNQPTSTPERPISRKGITPVLSIPVHPGTQPEQQKPQTKPLQQTSTVIQPPQSSSASVLPIIKAKDENANGKRLPNSPKPLTPSDYKAVNPQGIPWEEFSNSKPKPLTTRTKFPADPTTLRCSQEVEDKINQKLSEEDFAWCKWALSDTGGRVKVGKSYGTLGARDRDKYEKLNCNSVEKGQNPSCDDAWGDNSIKAWRKNVRTNLCGEPGKVSSKVVCRESLNNAKACVFENVLLDFSKMHDVKRPGRTDSRSWDKGFLGTHCDRATHRDIDYYEFYEAVVGPGSRCDYVINETVVVYGHDDIKNLGHSMSDFMNVWAMLWLSGLGSYAKDIVFLNMDAIRMGHNYYDDLGKFSRHYELQFSHILQAKSFTGRNRVCIKRLLVQPRPVILFTWDGWWQDMPCTFTGPSSLYQRWNLQVRRLYDLYPLQIKPAESEATRILLIKRTAPRGAAHMYTSRVITNMDEINQRLRKEFPTAEILVEDLAKLSFEEQVRLVHSVSLIIGVHGAGVPTSMHMAIGRKNCCGIVEIFPDGEFKPIRGYGNMARRMGLHYRRLDVGSSHNSAGVAVPVDSLLSTTSEVLQLMGTQPSCVLSSALDDPFFDSVEIPREVLEVNP